jgi:hypothetical protein
VKDNLFWDLRDLPTAHILWGIKENQKLKMKACLLQNPIVRQELEQQGIIYKDIRAMVVSQSHIISTELHIPQDLLEALVLMHADKTHIPPDIDLTSEAVMDCFTNLREFLIKKFKAPEPLDGEEEIKEMKEFFEEFKKAMLNPALTIIRYRIKKVKMIGIIIISRIVA